MSTEPSPAQDQRTTKLDPHASSALPRLPERSATSLIDEQVEEMFANLEVNEYLAKCSRTIINESECERLQFLNQEIADLREQLDTAEDWDLHERTSLKYRIILHEEERNRMAKEAHTRALKDLRAREMRADRFDLIHEDIAWSEESISCLREKLKRASPEERTAILGQIKTYTDHIRKLLAQSARVATDPSVDWMAEPEPDLSSGPTVPQEQYESPDRQLEQPPSDATSRAAVRRPRDFQRPRTGRKAGRPRKARGARKCAAGTRPIELALKLASLLSSLATST